MGLWLRCTTPWQVEDLRPRGDALEYEETARNLVAGEGFCVVVDGGKYPSLYPFGFPLVLAGLFAVWDRGPGSGVVVVLATAVLTIAGVFRLASFAGREAAVVAALLLAASPAHVWWSRAVMSDVPAACAVVWILVGVVAAWRRDAGSLVWLALGAGIGLATSIRTAVALVAIPVAIAAVTHGTMATRLARLAALSGGLFLGLVPIFVYDQLRFGSPLRNGYDFWAPYPRFSRRFAFQPPRGGGTDPNLPFYLRALAGAGDLYPWPVAILIGLGLALGAWKTGPARRIAGLAGGLAILVVGMQSLFFWQGTRFLLLALPPLLAAAALPIAGPWALRAVALGLLLAASVSLMRTPQAYAPDQAFHEPTVLREIAAVMPPNAALLAHTNGPFFSRLVREGGSDRVWVPLGMDAQEFSIAWYRLEPYARVPDGGAWVRRGLDFSRPERLIDALLAEGRPVFLAVPRSDQVPRLQALVDEVRTHYRLVPVAISSHAPLYRVVPAG